MTAGSPQEGVLTLTNGEVIQLPVAFNARELTLAGNCHVVGADLLYGYDPTTGTGLLWCRRPAPHWQMVHSVTRAGFHQWAADHYANLVREGLAQGGPLALRGLGFAELLSQGGGG